MKIDNMLTDEAILAEVGVRIAKRRLEFELTQAALATEAGIGKRTLERVEAGEAAQLSTIIRIFRVLNLLSNLNQMLPESRPGPIEVMERRVKVRQRASSTGKRPGKEQPWTWDDD